MPATALAHSPRPAAIRTAKRGFVRLGGGLPCASAAAREHIARISEMARRSAGKLASCCQRPGAPAFHLCTCADHFQAAAAGRNFPTLANAVGALSS